MALISIIMKLVLMIELITQVIVSLDGLFKKGLVELMLLNVFFIYNNYFF